MEDYIYQIRKYLPIQFIDEEANTFIKYLEESYLENIKNQKFQFAFIAFHMLYMTFCYKTKWLLKTQNNQIILKSLQDYISRRGKNTFFNVLFDLSQIPEKDIFCSLLIALKGFNSNDIDNCKIHVTRRNHCAHASGKIEYNGKEIDFLISDEIKYIEKMQKRVQPNLLLLLENFLNNNWEKSFIGIDINNYFVSSNISIKDLDSIVKLNLTLFKVNSDNEKVIYKKILYLILISEAQKYIETEVNIFLEKLPMFMLGITENIKIQKNGEEKIKTIREIIEEHLIPVISEFNNEDRKRAEKILNL